MIMNNIDFEMEEIMKLYTYMNDEDKDRWSLDAAKEMYNDEILYCSERSMKNPLIGGFEVLYDTIRELIAQDEA